MGGDSQWVRRDAPSGSVQVPGVVVVGGGAAGLAAATAVRAAGVPVSIVTDGPLGGDCTWHGCVPTKSLLEAAAAGLDARAAVDHARAVVARVARTENEHVMRAAGIEVVRARAVLETGPLLRLDDRRALAPRVGVVLATGSRPRPVEAVRGAAAEAGPGGPLVRDTDGWLDGLAEHLDRAGGGRRDVLVVGGGSSGSELAQALARLGAAGPDGTVTLLERDPELVRDVPGAGPVLAAALRRDGVQVVTAADGSTVRRLAVGAGLVLVAAGRSPVLDVLAPSSGVDTAGGAVVVDATMATTAPGVSAAGDVVGVSPSTHVAVATGRVAAAGLLHAAVAGAADGPVASFDRAWVPRVVWTDPQAAAVGRVPGGPASRVVRVPLSRNDRAPAAAVPGRPDRSRGGFAQVWVDASAGGGRLVGAVVVGPHAGELVGEAALVGRLGLTVQEWVGGRVGLGGVSAQHAYPAWSWTWALVADRLLGR